MLNSDLSARLKSLLLLEDPSSSSSEPKKNDALLQRTQLEEISSNQQHKNSQESIAPSLAEQMMATAESAQKSLKEEQRNGEQKRAKNATFGMKKGFLQKNKAKKVQADTRSIAIQKQQQRNNLIVELDSNGNTASPNFLSQDDCMPTSNNENSSTSSSNPLYLPEVQDALSSHLQSDQSKWTSQTFLTSLSQHPMLSKGWNDPRYMAALESMKTHPKDTIEKLKADEPEILHWLMEFLGVMGDHFMMLGENDNGTKEGKKNDKVLEENPKLLREMGPLEEKAMKRSQKTQPTTDQKQHKTINGMDDEVTKILSNDDLRSILSDPEMQQVMEECASVSVGVSKLQYYMRHDNFGPKLRMLMQAGLLKIA